MEAPILGISYVYVGLSYVYIWPPEALVLHESCGYEVIKIHGHFRDQRNLAATLEIL